MIQQWAHISFGITTLLSGFYGGVGFFTAMGGNPALKRLSDKSFAEYWQHIDFFMAARMKIFGPLLLLSFIITIVGLLPIWQTPSFWLMVLALGVIIGDIAFTFSTNHPLNKLIQSWDLNNLPNNVAQVRQQVVKAFSYRLLFMMTSFLLVVLAVWVCKGPLI
jgi:uncharacterized membrane protein